MERLKAALSERYRIEGELGEGGMATVYLAEDLRHNRKVALKVLKPDVAAVVGAERFLGEIRTTAKLQHPHILPLFDSGEADGFLFYVMPYVEGESVRDRLERERQLSVDTAVGIARIVASALEYAHEQGVVHRDIKPANILLSRGEALVADFGIALALSEAGGRRITETGLSLGTPQYMSPEQAAGERSLDSRSDIYALGCVLFEMLTGEPPHAGPTAQVVLAKILTDEVRRVTQLRRAVPPNVDAAVAHALEKLPADRFASAKQFLEALDDPGYRHGAPSPADGVAGARTAGRWRATALVLAVTTAALAAGLVLRETQPSSSVFRVTVALPEAQGLLTPQLGSSLALSPDGSRLVYTGFSATGSWQLWMRRADALEATPLEATQASYTPVFSPDGDRLAFVAPMGSLQILDLERSSARTLTDSAVEIVDWTREGEIYYYRGVTPGDMWRIRQEGGDPEPVPVVSGAPGRSSSWGPGVVLPGGEAMVVTRYPAEHPSPEAASVMAVDFESGSVTQLMRGSNPRYLDEGYLLWCAPEGMLMAAPFDTGAMELTGPPLPVAEGVLLDASGTAHYAVSSTGALVYRSTGTGGGTGGLAWVRRDGTLTPASDLEVGLTVGLWDAVDLSPDGSRAALTITEDTTSHIWVQRLGEAAPPRRVTFSGTFNVRPNWTPGGDSLSFVSNMGGAEIPTQLWMKAADGTGSPIPLVQSDREVEEGFLSPDGAWVVYRLGGTTSNRDIYALRRGVDAIGTPLAATGVDERSVALSPDGRWLAYVSDEGGRDEVFVTPFPDVTGGKWQVSSGGGQAPIWAHNGHELFFVGSSNDLMVAEYAVSGGAFVVSRIDPLFSANGLRTGVNHSAYAVSQDDQRFLMISLGSQQGQLVWVRNWMEGLRSRAREGRASS